ncbi:MAG: MBL fold metallo-hydrolase, partial [Gemmatimonadaceae bacterium]
MTIDQPVHGIVPVGCQPADCGDASRTVAITFLGVAGLLIEHDGHVLLTAPFFSNPSLAQVRPRVTRLLRSSPRIAPDTSLIERFLPASADRATTILVGHGHYDHLMDVPYIATHRATSATIYGSPTVRHMLMGDSTLRANGGRRVVAIPAAAIGTPRRRGVWYYSADSAYRFMALLASHAPTYRAWRQSYTFTSGTIDADLDSLPHTAAEWKLGEPYSYLIDVL